MVMHICVSLRLSYIYSDDWLNLYMLRTKCACLRVVLLRRYQVLCGESRLKCN